MNVISVIRFPRRALARASAGLAVVVGLVASALVLTAGAAQAVPLPGRLAIEPASGQFDSGSTVPAPATSSFSVGAVLLVALVVLAVLVLTAAVMHARHRPTVAQG